jgi:thymidylate synthase
MVCSLMLGETTVQSACTSSVQFARTGNKLDLTVNQRSSDVILGLPNDAVVWATILHLVRRELFLRTKGEIHLYAGTLNFCISSGGAHVYELNNANFEELLRRPRKTGIQPKLVMQDCMEGIFDIAKNYARGNPSWTVEGYGIDSHHERMKIEQAVDS